MFYSTVSSETDTSPVPSENVTWEQFCELFKTHAKQPSKSGRAFIPARTNSRKDADIRELEAAVFDLEGANHTPLGDDAMRSLCERLQDLDFVLHTTYSGHGHYRLIIRLASPVPVSQWAGFWRGVVNAYQLPVDESCKNPGRIYFLPSSPDGGGFTETNVGSPLAFSEGLQEQPSAREVVSGRSDGLSAEGSPVDLEPLRKCLKGLRKKENHELAQRILRGEPLANPGNRDNTVNRAAALLATVSDGASLPSILALVEPSLKSMHTAPEGEQHWLAKFKSCYERALERVRVKLARQEEDAKLLGLLSGGASTGGGSSEVAGGGSWKQGLIPKLNSQGEVIGIAGNEANISLILDEDEAWKGKVKFNDLSKQIEVQGPIAPEPSTLEVNTSIWLQRSDYKITVRPHNVGPVLLAVARRNRYDPLTSYLNSLRWDGKERSPRFFADYFGATDTPYVRLIGERWLVSAAARGLSPGEKVDNVLILEANQGAGKSKALHALATPFFTDTPIDVHNKDSRMQAAMTWIIELGELTSFRKADAETLKSFFSAREDFFRPPYGRVPEKFLRRAIFVGSTNLDEYLSDDTGNRRYWPIRVADHIPTEPIMADRDQIWAEATEKFRSGAPFYLSTAEEKAKHTEETRSRLLGDDASGVIYDWLLSKAPVLRSQEYRVIDVLQGAFASMPDQLSNTGLASVVGRALNKLGFEKVRRRVAGRPTTVYKTPQELLTAPKIERKSAFAT